MFACKRHEEIEALMAQYEILACKQDALRQEDTNRSHVNVQGAQQLVAKTQRIRETQEQMEQLKRQLVHLIAGRSPVQSRSTTSSINVGDVPERSNRQPLRITIMSEAELSQIDSKHLELRDSCVVLMNNSVNSTAISALAGCASAAKTSAVEVHGSNAAVLDAAARYQASGANYLIGFSAAELPAPDSAAGAYNRSRDETAPGEWAAQHSGVNEDTTLGPAQTHAQRRDDRCSDGGGSSAFSGLPGTTELAQRFDAPLPKDSRSQNTSTATKGDSTLATTKTDPPLKWADHPQWLSWPFLSPGDDDRALGLQSSQDRQEEEASVLLYASPAAARAIRSCSNANLLLLGCWSNINAVCRRVGDWWSEPSADELVRRPDQNTHVILLCLTPQSPDPRRNLAVPAPPSAEQLLAGVVLFQLMQDLDLDLGEAENNNGSSFDIRDGILSTRIIAQYVVGCLSEGDDGWLHLWTDAFEQQYKQFQGMTGAAISALAEATVMQHTVGSMHANCSSRGGVNGNEVELPDHAVSTVAQYDRHLRQFVVASMARQAVARIKPKL